MLQRLNAFLQKWMPFITPTSVILGVTILSFLHSYAFLVTWIFAFISFASCIGLNINEIKESIAKPLKIVMCLLIIQVIMPLVAFLVGFIFFNGDIYTITGLVLAFTIPTGVVSLMWVSIYQGDRALTLSIVLINTIISPLTVPFILNLLLGANISMDTFGLMQSLFLMIVAPSLLAIYITKLLKERAKQTATMLAPFSKIALIFVIIINGAVVSPYFINIDGRVVAIAITVLLISCSAYTIGLLITFLFNWDKRTAISIMYNSGMRNNGAGAALAITYFPPTVAFPVVLAILFQQFLASMSGKLVEIYLFKQEETEEKNDKTALKKSM
ncbi:bile acid:sodium symporter family protein [Evansella sp. AB-rgal1]|uniref:bile acid:sodium symporter family protein n=1 Tax=Evansella sp. AB-rgal1 TaxID=3242696 RepID=UPI00359DC259